MERNLSVVLKSGGLLSVALMIIGIGEGLFLHADMEHTPYTDLGEMFSGLVSFDPVQTLYAGVLVLIITPLCGLFYMMVHFLMKGSFRYSLMCLIIFLMLAIVIVQGG
ncbi:DUF1634 domain-containing protein [Limisalsivibrio acetivorans]|uniref:DUF1634 domain-containing protein n=1 Tax=Limisalsivibrio acetivorans TaxID=1304888 RepID=UPI00138AF504|nr:DUF1634 domain-containing protein [Limisalsivibrio acetivorans]